MITCVTSTTSIWEALRYNIPARAILEAIIYTADTERYSIPFGHVQDVFLFHRTTPPGPPITLKDGTPPYEVTIVDHREGGGYRYHGSFSSMCSFTRMVGRERHHASPAVYVMAGAGHLCTFHGHATLPLSIYLSHIGQPAACIASALERPALEVRGSLHRLKVGTTYDEYHRIEIGRREVSLEVG